MNRRVAVRGIFVHRGKLLCVKLKPYKESIKNDYWCVIGGGVDAGEALIPALEREIIEETAIKPIIGNLLYVQQFASSDKEQLEFFFNILNPHDYLNIDLSKTTHGAEEIEDVSYIDPKLHDVRPEFLTSESLTNITPKTATKIFNYL